MLQAEERIDEIMEKVGEICGCLIGQFPRSRVRIFAEQLANSLLFDSSTSSLERLIESSAQAAFLDPKEVSTEIQSQDEGRDAKELIIFENGRFWIADSPLPSWTAHDFCATRFGSEKLKTLPNRNGKEEASLQHAYTKPSLLAYQQLGIYLSTIAEAFK